MNRPHPRITTPVPAGSDPHPAEVERDTERAAEDRPEAWGEHIDTERDATQRLLDEVPPHHV